METSMLYVGHFKFDSKTKEEGNGHFTCVVESDDIKSAIAAFHKLIMEAQKASKLFNYGAKIYVSAMIELKQIPKVGVITYFEEAISELKGNLNAALPYPPDNNCNAFNFCNELGDGEFEDLLFLEF